MLFLETSVFTRRIVEFMSDDDYAELQQFLAANPEAGDIIPSTGGLRKIRWSGSGRGKRGGTRVIYYWWIPDQIMMLFAYKKNEAEDLTESQKQQLRRIVEEWWNENK